MGPNLLFDKSFLQSLSVDESVWLDHFFTNNICPLFYVETLGDLGKAGGRGRSAEQEVAMIANKFPEMSASPTAHHVELAHNNLFGFQLPMDGRIPMPGGNPVGSGNRRNVVYEGSKEAEAFARWVRGEFLQVERRSAGEWRVALESMDLNALSTVALAFEPEAAKCKSLAEAREIARRIVRNGEKIYTQFQLASLVFSMPQALNEPLVNEWRNKGSRPLSAYAPYAAFVLEVEIFFQIAILASLISAERPSNRTDIAYVFYLPFCRVFVSGDRFHRNTVPLFLRDDQDFVWGPDLKKGLAEINDFYMAQPEDVKSRGIMSFAGTPPIRDGSVVADLWDRHTNPAWRDDDSIRPPRTQTDGDAALVEEIMSLSEGEPIAREDVDFDLEEAEGLTIKRQIRVRRGSWFQTPPESSKKNKPD